MFWKCLTFAKSEISKYGHSSENARGNIILTNSALQKIRIPIFVEHFLKPVQINSLIESSVIVWRRRSAFQILIQKGHMHVYVPYSKILKKSKKFWDLNAWTFFLKASPDCGLLEAIANWYWHNARKGSEIFVCRKIKQVLQEKKSESVNIEFSLRRKQIRKNRKTEFPTFWRF